MNQYSLIVGKTDLATVRKDLTEQWDYEKNGGLRPCDVQPGTTKKVWWRCEKGHSWEAYIYSRSAGTGCPYCAGNVLEQGVNDVATKAPELIKEWDYEKNKPFIPSDVAAGSSRKVWWKCKENHSWEAVIYSRALFGRGCPYCCGKKILVGYNDLAHVNPELAREWNQDMNGGLLPTQVTASSHRKVWWTGKCGHIWETQVANRSTGTGCPYCNGRKVLVGFNDLESQCQWLVQEWNYEKNEMTPSEVNFKSSRKVWWICSEGHEWEAEINDRRLGQGCPVCINKRIVTGINDLASVHPELLEEWDTVKNKGISPEKIGYRTDRKVWWICPKGHSYKTSVYNRNKGCGCFVCSQQADKHHVTSGVNDLRTYSPEIASEWDYQRNGELTPDSIMPFSNRKVWWLCDKGHHWQCSVQIRQKGTGCPFCMGKVHRGSMLI
jgi:hypothetical protein